MHRDASILVIEDRDEFEAGTECFEVLAQGRHPDVICVFKFGDRTLGDVEPSGELRLADRLTVAELERSLLRGEEMPGAELVLQELRRDARDGKVAGARDASVWAAFVLFEG